MTETQEAPKMSLADAFALVQVTTGEAIGVLNSLAEENADKNPGLTASVNAAIANLATGGATQAAEETTQY